MFLQILRLTLFCCLPFVVGCGSAAPVTDKSSAHNNNKIVLKQKLDNAKKLAVILNPELLQSLRRYVRLQVFAGFDTPQQIVTSAVEFDPNLRNEKELKPLVETFLKESLAEQMAAQQKWPTVTDCDRLDQAFRALETEGIFCRQNVRTNGSCGLILIKSEIDERNKSGHLYDGYVIYYAIDTDFAIQGRGLNLSFDAAGANEEPNTKTRSAVEIGSKIVAALEANGLHPQWDGTTKSRIFVSMDWKRRR